MGKWQTRWLLLAAALQIGAALPRARDWRAMAVYGHDLAFVDADLVRRSDDRLVFEAVWLPTDADTAGEGATIDETCGARRIALLAVRSH